jgi:predicted phosphodiesterase
MAVGRDAVADDRFGSPHGPSAVELVTRRRPVTPDAGFVPLPEPVGEAPYRLELADVVGAERAAEIEAEGSLTFHALGDSGGDVNPRPQRGVAGAVVRGLAGMLPASFMYHLGDLVYPHGEETGYRAQFWVPYARYHAPIFGVPGNHDADRKPTQLRATLDPWVATFCTTSPPLHEVAVGRRRPAPRQPNVHWTLVHPWLRIIGVYTNVPEGGQLDDGQLAWLIGELRASPADTITILAMHQPVYSADVTHGSNLTLADTLDACVAQAGRRPDAVLTGHAHCYQRFTRRVDGREIPHVVAGAGGFHELHPLGRGIGDLPRSFDGLAGLEGVSLDAYEDRRHGFLTVTVRPGEAEFGYDAVAGATVERADAFTVSAPDRR